jgi:hypothetical protein
MRAEKESKIGLAVMKLQFDENYFYLMRRNDKWKDYNFIGGHTSERDNGSLQRAANREVREEVPGSRFIRYALPQLTPVLTYGPVYSRSAHAMVIYKVQFFLISISVDPTPMLKSISLRSKNRLVSQTEIIKHNPAITNFAKLLDEHVEGGLANIPLSWSEKLPAGIRAS